MTVIKIRILSSSLGPLTADIKTLCMALTLWQEQCSPQLFCYGSGSQAFQLATGSAPRENTEPRPWQKVSLNYSFLTYRILGVGRDFQRSSSPTALPWAGAFPIPKIFPVEPEQHLMSLICRNIWMLAWLNWQACIKDGSLVKFK